MLMQALSAFLYCQPFTEFRAMLGILSLRQLYVNIITKQNFTNTANRFEPYIHVVNTINIALFSFILDQIYSCVRS